MTRTDRRGSPILDGVETAVAAARGAVSTATRSAFHRGLAQTFTPPPPDFRRPAIAGPLYFVSTALDSSALPHARTAPQTPLVSRQVRLPMDSARQAGRAEGFQRPQAKTSQHLRAISLSHAGERCHVDSQVVCDSRTAGSPARAIAARSPLLRAGTTLHPTFLHPALPISPHDIDRALALVSPASTARALATQGGAMMTCTDGDDDSRSCSPPWRRWPSQAPCPSGNFPPFSPTRSARLMPWSAGSGSMARLFVALSLPHRAGTQACWHPLLPNSQFSEVQPS